MPRVSEEHVTARREQILEAARACFRRNGLHNTSMQDLIHEAGLSVGAVYRYFKSKDEIINAIASTVVGTIEQRMVEIASRRLPLVDSLDLAIAAVEDQAGPEGNLPIALQVWAEATLDESIGTIVRARFLALRSGVRVLVEHAVESGELDAGVDVDAVAAAAYSLIPGYILQRMLLGTPQRETYVAGIRALTSLKP